MSESNKDLFVKISTGALSVELSGSEDTVQKLLDDIKKEGLGVLSKPTSEISPAGQDKAVDTVDDTPPVHGHADDRPSLYTLVLGGKPKTESDWVLVYIAYGTEFGSNTVTDEKIRELYKESNRANESRSKNYSNNIKKLTIGKYIAPVTKGVYRITNEGLNYVNSIIND